LGWPGAIRDLVYVWRSALPSDESSASRDSWVDLVDVSLHTAVYGDADPPRRALVGGIAPIHEEISILFHQPFPISYQRAPDLLTDEAYAIHMALRKTLLP
jgi:hypothetical protein